MIGSIQYRMSSKVKQVLQQLNGWKNRSRCAWCFCMFILFDELKLMRHSLPRFLVLNSLVTCQEIIFRCSHKYNSKQIHANSLQLHVNILHLFYKNNMPNYVPFVCSYMSISCIYMYKNNNFLYPYNSNLERILHLHINKLFFSNNRISIIHNSISIILQLQHVDKCSGNYSNKYLMTEKVSEHLPD